MDNFDKISSNSKNFLDEFRPKFCNSFSLNGALCNSIEFFHKPQRFDGIISTCRGFYARLFTREFKPKLEGRPKFFFNEWCQKRVNVNTKNVKRRISRSDDKADWLIYNAAQPMYPTYANTIKGSYSTQAFCKLLKKRGETKHMQDILTLVTQEDYKTEIGSSKHLHPITCSSLVKHFYLLLKDKIMKARNF